MTASPGSISKGLVAIRQARLEPLALSASGHERMVNGWAEASSQEIEVYKFFISFIAKIIETIARLPGGLSEQIAMKGRSSW